jgi:hypothetical protein
MKPLAALSFGVAAVLAATALWHGPGGAGERLANGIDREVRQMLDANDAPPVVARMQRGELMRRVIFRGQGDDFQRGEMVRLAEELPGVAEARWNRPRGFRWYPLPLLVESMTMALIAFAVGAIVAYVGALRARNRY